MRRAAAGTIAEALRDDLRGLTSASHDPVRPIVVRAVIHAGPARIREIRAELTALLARLTRRPPRARAEADPRRYALTLALLRSEPQTRARAPARRPSPTGACGPASNAGPLRRPGLDTLATVG